MQHTRRIDTDSDWSAFQALALGEQSHSIFDWKKVLKLQRHEGLFHFQGHPFYRHGLLAAFGLWDGDCLVATVAAASDLQLIRDRREKVGFLGFFAHRGEAKPEGAEELLDQALTWLRSEGLKAVLAPVDLDFIRTPRWRSGSEPDEFWRPIFMRKGFHEVDQGLDFQIDLQTLTWPAPFEGRAEISQQSTRIQLNPRPLPSRLVRSMYGLWNPSRIRQHIESDLELREWVSKSDINWVSSTQPLPWNRVPLEADWLAWRQESHRTAFELEGDVLGRRAVWVRGAWISQSGGSAQIQQVEIDPAFKEFDLLPWTILSVSRWCLDQGVRTLHWLSLSEETPLSKVLTEGLGRSNSKSTSLWGAALV